MKILYLPDDIAERLSEMLTTAYIARDNESTMRSTWREERDAYDSLNSTFDTALQDIDPEHLVAIEAIIGHPLTAPTHKDRFLWDDDDDAEQAHALITPETHATLNGTHYGRALIHIDDEDGEPQIISGAYRLAPELSGHEAAAALRLGIQTPCSGRWNPEKRIFEITGLR